MTQEITSLPIEKANQPGPITPPSLQSLFGLRIANALAATNCHTIGKIINFYPLTQTADISINFIKIIINDPSPNVAVPYPNLVNCPVVIMSGGGGALTFPISPGDDCLVMFNDRDFDAWYQSGQITLPNSNRIHDLSDGIALVGINSLATSLTDYLANGVQLRYKTSSATLIETAAALIQGDNTVSVEDRVKIAVGLQTLADALDDLCTALISATITGGAFSGATITALTNAQAKIDVVLK